jgi:hypothetical protein
VHHFCAAGVAGVVCFCQELLEQGVPWRAFSDHLPKLFIQACAEAGAGGAALLASLQTQGFGLEDVPLDLPRSCFNVACQATGNAAAVDALFMLGYPIALVRQDIELTLIPACAKGYLPVVQALIAAGLDRPDFVAGYKEAVLQACANGHAMVLEALFEAGMEVGDVGDAAGPALCSACEGNHVDVARVLLQRGLPVEVLRCRHNFPLRAACGENCPEILQLLLQHGLTVDDLRDDEREAVLIACRHGHLDVLRVMLAAGLTKEDFGDPDVLFSAQQYNHPHVVDWLLSVLQS